MGMDLGFGSTDLAALCNAERLMVERWGTEMGRTVGKRLLDLAATTAETIERIPTASVVGNDDGAMTITFDDVIAISGQLTTGGGGAPVDADQFVISRIRIKEDTR
jgi:hypothetical protein